MELLQQILYTLFGILTIAGGLLYLNSSLEFIVRSGFRKQSSETNSMPLLIGLIGLLLTYIWL